MRLTTLLATTAFVAFAISPAMAQIVPDAQDRHKVFYSTAMRLFGFAEAAHGGT